MSGGPQFMVEAEIGERVVEMADRLLTADKIVPGTVASCTFKLDETEFEVVVRVKRAAVSGGQVGV